MAPLSRYQQDIVATALTHPDLPLAPGGYVRLPGPADVDRLKECIRRTALRHDAMRLRLEEHGDKTVQQVVPDCPDVEVVSFLSESDPREACQRWMSRSTDDVIALDGPLVKFTILAEDTDSLIVCGWIHHVAADGWGIDLLIKEIAERYYSNADETAEETPAPSCLDLVAADEAYRSSPDWQADRDALTAAMGVLTPALFARTATGRGRRHRRKTVHIDALTADRIRATGRSIFSVTAAALAAYLRRVHRDGDIVLGMPMLNRETPIELATVSNVTNILPLHVAIDEQRTLVEIADQVRSEVRGLKSRQRFALGDLRAALRDAGQPVHDLFDVTYSYMIVAEHDVETNVMSSGYSLGALNVLVREYQRNGSLDVHVFYADDVFDDHFAIESAIDHVMTLLGEGLRAPDTPLAALSLISPAEAARLSGFERPHTVEFDESATIDRLVAEQAGRAPDRPAVAGSDGVLTYEEFHRRVSHLALELGDLRPDECVPVLLPRSPEFLVAIHAVLAAGGAYVPIDPQHPEQRVRTLLTDCDARLVVTDGKFDGLLDELGIRPVDPSETGELVDHVTPPRPTDLAYVIYTSGSTGMPKGAMIEHRSVVNRLIWMQRQYPLRDNDIILHKTPATFDVSVWELMWWALAGASVAVAPPGAERDPRELGAAIERHGATVMHFVPSMLSPFLDHVEQNPQQVRSLRLVFCSGEALTPALAERFRSTLPGVQLANLYGPTEATVDVSYYDISALRPINRVPIGRPIDNIALMVLDTEGRRCPIGVPGELNIAGVGVGRGYLGQPERTAEAFVDDASIPEGRRYRTGDLARWLSDGTLEYLGRFDDQVKIRGNRITLGEIESALARCPDVAAATVVDERSETGTRLVAYVVARAGERPGLVRSLVGFLADRLPSYMIPSDFVLLNNIPLTGSGKADRRALAALGRRERESALPSTPVERKLADIWSAVLGSSEFGVHDDFFTVGGDSILVLRMRTEAEKRGLAFDVDRFYANPTIAGLAVHVAHREHVSGNPVTVPFELVPAIDRASFTDGIEDAFPATQLQLGMLYHSLERADSTLYKDAFAYRLRMPWDEDKFRRAYYRMVRRQPALRSNFDLTGRATPLQVVFREIPDTLEIDSSGSDATAYLERMHRTTYRLVDDGEHTALHGMRVFVREDCIELVFHFHHAILDGWSVASLLSDLLADYLSDAGADLASPSTFLLAEYARTERQSQQDPVAREFWVQALEAARSTSIESARNHLAPEPDGSSLMTLSSWLDRCVKQFARVNGVPLKSVLLAAHCLALRAMTGSDDVVTGCVTHARPQREDAESCAGLFLNTIPVRLDGEQETWRDAVEHIVRWERDTFPHRRFPLSPQPFDTAFNFVNYHQLGQALGGVELVDVTIREETNFTLLTTAMVDPRDGRIRLRISTGGEGLAASQCTEFGRALIGLLGEIVRDPDGEIALWAAGSGDVTALVDQVATLHPAKTAVVSDTGQWDYLRLNDIADAVAQELLRRGMPTGARVAIRMPRSIELVAAVLGAMRAGAAVVPLDPAYPEARIRLMAEIAEPYLTVTGLDELLCQPADGEPLPLPRIHPEDVAYVLFTSGSTGEPKGVAVPHRVLTNLIRWQNQRPTTAVGRTTLQFAPLSFDVSFQEIFSTLCGGGTLRVIDERTRQDMVALLKTIDEGGVDRIYLPYVALQGLAEAAAVTGVYPASLRTIMSSGEQLRITPEIRALCAANPGTVLENQYGPTETHVALAHQLPGEVSDHPPLPPIGAAISAITASLLDEKLRPVRPGVKGEIYLEGACVAQGYEKRPGLTAQRFVAGPNGTVRYRTGDIGLALPNGDIVCLGRADTQVKVRGFRVEVAEVELAILALAARYPGVEQAAVVARSLGGPDAVLQAFLVGDADRVPVEALRSELRQVLPPHMVPSTFQWIDAMPLTPSGKRDDAALRAIGSRGSDTVVSAGDELEEAVAGLLAEFAGVDALGVDTGFFDAGGTSIGATRVAMTIAKRWGVDLQLQTFLAAPTAREIAAVIRAHDGSDTFDPVVPLREAGDGVPLFLIHPIGGTVLCYRQLVNHLPADRPVHALQAAGTQPGTEPLTSMESLAASYIEAIRRVHPDGPFHLAGWSFGGFVAVEIARQLDPAQVSSLTVLDTIALGAGPRTALDEKQMITFFIGELLASSRGDVQLDDELGDIVDLTSALDRCVELGVLPRDSSPQLVRRLYRVFRANMQAGMDYRVENLRRPLLLLRATEEMPSGLAVAHRNVGTLFNSPDNGWEQWTEEPVEIVKVPGNHLSMMDAPNVQVLADELGLALQRADSFRSARAEVAQ
ncbi:non-ribosomal peptide synthetase [Longimycelium tulufanense]|uniref:Non-ribosomal peptide synthetase n=1 Tax=Longimycelium tulufanense TaxID=907463 RepID=A0A8J3FSD0_9PSEU|nr:non-ribosomal peptide synthetase [Longimycelium tulufanense]